MEKDIKNLIASVDVIAQTTAKIFETMATKEELAKIHSTMATKEDVAQVRADLQSFKSETHE